MPDELVKVIEKIISTVREGEVLDFSDLFYRSFSKLIEEYKNTSIPGEKVIELLVKNKFCLRENVGNIQNSSILSISEKVFILIVMNSFDRDEMDKFVSEIKVESLSEYNELVKSYYLCWSIEKQWPGVLDILKNMELVNFLKESIDRRIINVNESFLENRNSDLENNEDFRVCIIASILSPNPLSAHFNLSYTLLKIFNEYKKKYGSLEFGFALSGESSLNVFGREIRVLDKHRENLHLVKWAELSKESESFFNGAVKGGSESLAFFGWLNKFNPDLVLFIGDGFESKFYRRQVYHNFPTAYFPMNVGNNPKGFVDGVISKKDKFTETMRNIGSGGIVKEVTPVFDLYLEKKGNERFCKRNLGDVVFVTPLHGGRIEHIFLNSITLSDIDEISKTFIQNKNFVWLLIGQDSLNNIIERWPVLKAFQNTGQLQTVGFLNNFIDFIQDCDCAFVMPYMKGGNQGVSSAMSQGLAVISSDSCDTSGIAPNENSYQSTQQAFQLVEKMCIDKAFLLNAKINAKESINRIKPSNVAQEWVSALKDISMHGKNRLRNKSVEFSNPVIKKSS